MTTHMTMTVNVNMKLQAGGGQKTKTCFVFWNFACNLLEKLGQMNWRKHTKTKTRWSHWSGFTFQGSFFSFVEGFLPHVLKKKRNLIPFSLELVALIPSISSLWKKELLCHDLALPVPTNSFFLFFFSRARKWKRKKKEFVPFCVFF